MLSSGLRKLCRVRKATDIVGLNCREQDKRQITSKWLTKVTKLNKFVLVPAFLHLYEVLKILAYYGNLFTSIVVVFTHLVLEPFEYC